MAKPMTLRELVNWVPPDYTMVAGLPSLASLSRPAYRGLSRATMVASVPIQRPGLRISLWRAETRCIPCGYTGRYVVSE